jgi:hypothetical protein
MERKKLFILKSAILPYLQDAGTGGQQEEYREEGDQAKPTPAVSAVCCRFRLHSDDLWLNCDRPKVCSGFEGMNRNNLSAHRKDEGRE